VALTEVGRDIILSMLTEGSSIAGAPHTTDSVRNDSLGHQIIDVAKSHIQKKLLLYSMLIRVLFVYSHPGHKQRRDHLPLTVQVAVATGTSFSDGFYSAIYYSTATDSLVSVILSCRTVFL